MSLTPTRIIKELIQLPDTLTNVVKAHYNDIGSLKAKTKIVFNINNDLKTFIIPISISKILDQGEGRLNEWRVQSRSKNIMSDDGKYFKPKYLIGIKFDTSVLLSRTEVADSVIKFNYFLLTEVQKAISVNDELYDINALMEGYVNLIIDNAESSSPRNLSFTIEGVD